MKKYLFIFVFSTIILTSSLAIAGELGDRLQREIIQKSPDQLIPVWISVSNQKDSYTFKKEIANRSQSRAERHKIAIEELKASRTGQPAILEYLSSLEKRGLATDIKRYWITNTITASVTAGEIDRLKNKSNIDIIYLEPKIEIIKPETLSEEKTSSASIAGVTSNISHINAPAAWAAGYTGAGRIVCIFDNGVLGSHSALVNNWKGQDGDSAAAWFDPRYEESFPHVIGNDGHGTHVTGLAVGHDDISGDTVGVALDAKWISAAVINVNGAARLDAFQWAADPDGNPNTIDDVPDVISHSWGFINASCLNIFYDAIRNTEALGIVNIFAVGNIEGGFSTVHNPADGAADSLDCFSVGNLVHTNVPPSIATNSSRGPSPCDLTIIKPNVVAPGRIIRSTWIDGGYTDAMSGSSMATPQVSGLVVLLRQKNPNATVDEIKEAIIKSTQRANFGTIPNNDYGWGEIDCKAALDSLSAVSSAPNVRVYDFTHDPIAPGDTVVGTVLLQNIGTTVTSVTGQINGTHPALNVLNGNVTFGTINQDDTTSSVAMIEVVVNDTVAVGSIVSIDFQISGDDYSTQAQLHFVIEPLPKRSIVTHNTGRIVFSLTNRGVYGLGTNSMFVGGGSGFTFDGGGNELWEGGIIAGTGYSRISSSIHSYLFEPDRDFVVSPGGDIDITALSGSAAEATFSIFDDAQADDPLGLQVKQESYIYNPPNDDFVILRHILHNISDVDITDLYYGLFMDFDATSYYKNAGGFDSTNMLTWTAYNNGTNQSPLLSDYRGICLISGQFAGGGAAPSPVVDIYPPTGSPFGNGFSDIKKYNIIKSGMLYANQFDTSIADIFSFISAGPITLAPGQTDTVVFAVVAGDSRPEIEDAASRASSVILSVDQPGIPTQLPSSFKLIGNYPNPFNPTTIVSFEMPHKGEYLFEVINMLGQIVHKQKTNTQPGIVNVFFDGNSFASGAYFYRITVEEQSLAGKMMLLK